MSVVSAVVSVLFAASTQVGSPVCADMVWSSRVNVLLATTTTTMAAMATMATRECPAWMHALGWC